MKIIVFYSGYLPGKNYGGPVTSIYNFTELLGKENEIYIVCSNHDLGKKQCYDNIKNGWNSVEKAKVNYLNDKEINKRTFKKVLKEIKPDLIYCSSIFSAKITIPVCMLGRKLNIPVILAPRGELNNTALTRGSLKKRVYLMLLKALGIINYVKYQATSSDEYYNIMNNLRVKSKSVFLLRNIPSLSKQKIKLYKSTGKIKICFVGRIVSNKNLLFALEIITQLKAEVEFDIYGAKEDLLYWNQCSLVINNLPRNIKARYCGVIDSISMRKKYLEYDVLISPTQFENYGQAIVEAMLHDTPVVISKNTTPWDDIVNEKAGFAISLNEKEEFVKVLNDIANYSQVEYEDLIKRLRKYCTKHFNNQDLKEQYIQTFNKVIERG